jgi:hypothetical protein
MKAKKVSLDLRVVFRFLLLAFSAFILLLITSEVAAPRKLPSDDEKEEYRTCSDEPQRIQIYCTEGIIDCAPKDC